MKKNKSLHMVLLISLMLGCASVPRQNFSSTPIDEAEFRRCPEKIKKQYGDVEKFDQSSDLYNMASSEYPDMDFLFLRWGAPVKKYPSWRNTGTVLEAGVLSLLLDLGGGGFGVLSITGLTLNPSAVYVWQKGDYIINCSAALSMFQGYKPVLRSWKWSYSGSGCEPLNSVNQAEQKAATESKPNN